jgi:hypothetical protein
MRKQFSISKKPALDDRSLEGGIEWIVARELAPIQSELLRLRAYVDALREAQEPW